MKIDETGPRPLRVLRVYDHLGYQGGVVHGPGRAILRVTPALREQGVETTLAFLAPHHPSASALEEKGIPCHFQNRSKWDPRALLDLLRLMRKTRPDVLHLGGMKSLVMGRLAAWLKPTPVVVHLHDTNPLRAPLKMAMKGLAMLATLGIGVSEAVCEHGRRTMGIPPAKMRVLHNGVQLDHYHPPAPDEKTSIRRELGIPEHAPVAGMVGRLRQEKSADIFLASVGALNGNLPDLHAVLVGDGPERAALENQAATLGLRERVHFLGQRDDIPHVVRALDVLAMPTRDGEGFPNAAIEAMASGVPVIGAQCGGLPEIVTHGENGLLVPPGDIGALSDALRGIFSDPVRHGHLSRAAVSRASAFSLAAHTIRQKAIYEECIQLFGSEGGFDPAPSEVIAAAWRKNVPEMWTALCGGFPSFVFDRKPEDLRDGIPAFCYHRIDRERFLGDLAFLKAAGYATAGADDLLHHLRGKPLPAKTIVLTIDDGLRDLYDVAFPLLQEYGFKAVAFVCPGFSAAASTSSSPVCGPHELAAMERSGHVDIQSHGFGHRNTRQYPAPSPLTGVAPSWQHRYRPDSFASLDEELAAARTALENWLQKPVRHLCLVQYAGSQAVIEAATRAGYEGLWWGTRAGRRANVPGARPAEIVRLSADFIRRLPGDGREPLAAILNARLG